MNLIVDANVFVSAAVIVEAHHADSKAFLNRVVQQNEQVYTPTLVLAETTAAIVRPTGNVILARQSVRRITTLPGLRLISLTQRRARHAAHIAAAHRLRGADAVYVALAAEFGATLITWDAEMLQRGAGIVSVMTPAQWNIAQTTP